MLGKVIFALCLVAVTANTTPRSDGGGYQCFSCADMRNCKYIQDQYSSNVETTTCAYGCYVQIEYFGGSTFVSRGCYQDYMSGQDGLQACYSQYDFCNDWEIAMTDGAGYNFAFPTLLTACVLMVKAIF